MVFLTLHTLLRTHTLNTLRTYSFSINYEATIIYSQSLNSSISLSTAPYNSSKPSLFFRTPWAAANNSCPAVCCNDRYLFRFQSPPLALEVWVDRLSVVVRQLKMMPSCRIVRFDVRAKKTRGDFGTVFFKEWLPNRLRRIGECK